MAPSSPARSFQSLPECQSPFFVDFEARSIGYGDVSFPLEEIKSMNASDLFFYFVNKDGCHHSAIGVKDIKNFLNAASQAATGKSLKEVQEQKKPLSEVPQVNYTVLNFAAKKNDTKEKASVKSATVL